MDHYLKRIFKLEKQHLIWLHESTRKFLAFGVYRLIALAEINKCLLVWSINK